MSKFVDWRPALLCVAAVTLAVLGLVVAPMGAQAETELLPPLPPGVPAPPLPPPLPGECGDSPPVAQVCSGYCPLILKYPDCKYKKEIRTTILYTFEERTREFQVVTVRTTVEYCGC